jgi:hypothetical protein
MAMAASVSALATRHVRLSALSVRARFSLSFTTARFRSCSASSSSSVLWSAGPRYRLNPAVTRGSLLLGHSVSNSLASAIALGAGVGAVCATRGACSHQTARCDAAAATPELAHISRGFSHRDDKRIGTTSTNSDVSNASVLPVVRFSLWGELWVLVWQNVAWILVGTSCLVLATIFQTKNVGRLTADLTVKVLSFSVVSSINNNETKRNELLSVLWSMIYWQGVSQALSFVGGAINRVVARRIRRGLQVSLYSELLTKDISLFDRHQMGELTQCVEERVEKLSQVVSAVVSGLPALVGVPLTLIQMWQASPELAKANATMVVTTVGALVCVYIVGIKRCSAFIAQQKAKATSAVTESFYAIRTVQAFDASSQMVNRYEQLLGASRVGF